MMRIVLPTGIFPPDIGGPASYVPRIAAALAARGHAVEVVTLADDPAAGGEFSFPVRRIRRGMARIPRMIRTVATIRQWARSADLIYANGLFIEAAIAAALARKPLVMKIVGDWAWERAYNQRATDLPPAEFNRARLSLRWELIKRLRTLVTRQAARIIVPSDFLKHLLGEWPVEEARIAVIHNALDPLPASVPPPGPPFRGFTLVTASRLIRLKNIAAIIRLVAARKDIRLVIIGTGPEGGNLRQIAMDAGASDRVIFTGDLDGARLRGWLEASHLFVLNSIHEGLPHVILECFQAGVPVLATAVGGVPELIRHGGNGWLIPPCDEEALRMAVDGLLADANLRKTLIAGGALRLRMAFTLDAMVTGTECILRAALEKGLTE